jgi:hypothetical protein
MIREIQVGDIVKLLDLPEWLTHDLPESEQVEIRAFIGRCAVVSEIDSYGYFWLGFGSTVEAGDSAHYSGHSFGVPRKFIEIGHEII